MKSGNNFHKEKMKKLSLYVFLVLFLSSCSEQSRITKKVESCADYYYQEYWVEKNQRTQKKIRIFTERCMDGRGYVILDKDM